MLDSYYWEMAFFHNSGLEHLQIVFIIPDKNFEISSPNNKLNWQLCKACKSKKRTTTYSIQQMQYHMFFESSEYTKPDVVAVYGNSRVMGCDKEDIQTEISYRNMTHSHHTILVLMDETEDLVRQGINFIKTVQSVDVIEETYINFERGFTDEPTNEKQYFSCLRRE